MKIKMSPGMVSRLQRKIDRYDFEVGVLEDKPHRTAVEAELYKEAELGTYAGGPVRKTTRQNGPQTIGQVLVENMERLNVNLLLAPFQQKDSQINRFATVFLRSAMAKGSMKRVENLLQAIVRNPILDGTYGPNKAVTADHKGFDRHLIDTGQMFKAIKARVIKRG